MSMIDALTPAQRKVLDAVSGGNAYPEATKPTIKILFDGGLVDAAVAPFTLTATAKTLYEESDAMRHNKTADFVTGQAVQYLKWGNAYPIRFAYEWVDAAVVGVGETMLTLKYAENGLTGQRRAISVRSKPALPLIALMTELATTPMETLDEPCGDVGTFVDPEPANNLPDVQRASAFTPRSKNSPLREQYLALKANYRNFVMFFRLGDFYELFDEDAEIAARELDLVLTNRPVNANERVPMCGVPYHAVESYIEKLTAKGYDVAVVEQVSEPTGKGLVEREVKRVILAPTVNPVEPELPAYAPRVWATPERRAEVSALLDSKKVYPQTLEPANEQGVWLIEDEWTVKTMQRTLNQLGVIIVGKLSQDWLGDVPYTTALFKLPERAVIEIHVPGEPVQPVSTEVAPEVKPESPVVISPETLAAYPAITDKSPAPVANSAGAIRLHLGGVLRVGTVYAITDAAVDGYFGVSFLNPVPKPCVEMIERHYDIQQTPNKSFLRVRPKGIGADVFAQTEAVLAAEIEPTADLLDEAAERTLIESLMVAYPDLSDACFGVTQFLANVIARLQREAAGVLVQPY